MSILTTDYRKTSVKAPSKIPAGLDAYYFQLVGMYNRRRSLRSKQLNRARQITTQSSIWSCKSDYQLKEDLYELKVSFRRNKRDVKDLVPVALSALRESAKRCLGLYAYEVQLAGALTIYDGFIAEMATGEGKTLTAALAAVLRGWIGYPCHLITANDYLAERDAKWLKPFYSYCDVSVGFVTSVMDPAARKYGYSQDVTYTTPKEILADFLRDRLALGYLQSYARRQIISTSNRQYPSGVVMRGIHTAIIDEIDSILIDEAVTPLIISRSEPNDYFVEGYNSINQISHPYVPEFYSVNNQLRTVELMNHWDELLQTDPDTVPPLLRSPSRRNELIKQALVAREFFHRDKQYVVQDDKIVIVDEFTGRLMHQRTYSAGLHQMLETKEGIPVTSPSETLSRLSFQKFFRFFFN